MNHGTQGNNLSQLNAEATQMRLLLGTMCTQFRTQCATFGAPPEVSEALANFEKATGGLADAVLAWTLKSNGGTQ